MIREEMQKAVRVLFKPGVVVELRALRDKKTVSGYYDEQLLLVEEAVKLDKLGFTIYVTLNEINPALFARAANRVEHYPKATTSDSDILRRRWLPLDFDPVRPSGVSSTKEEKTAALYRAGEVRDYLRVSGWPEASLADSGNGAHLLYRVDLPHDQRSSELVKGVLEALSFKFSDGAVSLDTSVGNAARIWKFYGTTVRKGDDIQERPHRVSRLLEVPEGDDGGVKTVNKEQLESITAMRPDLPPNRRREEHREFDLEGWIREHGISVKREGTWQGGGYRWILEECPWNGHTDGAAYIVQHANGAVAAGCHHDSCQGYGWPDLREHYDPGSQAHSRDGTRDADENGEVKPRLRSIRFNEIPEPGPRHYLLDGLVPEGHITLLHGDGGVAKSMLALSFGLAVAREADK